MPHLVDLSVAIGCETLSPPSVNRRVELTTVRRGPGQWQSTFVNMSLHTGSHADFPLHVIADGESAGDVPLDRLCGPAILVDLGDLRPDHRIEVGEIAAAGADILPGDIVLVRSGWTERMWGNFPDYYLRSPCCAPDACRWILDRGANAIGFDCFCEYAARLPEFTSEDFVIHRLIAEQGAILMQHLTNLSALPSGRHFEFFGAPIKIQGVEGSPARFFAAVEEGN